MMNCLSCGRPIQDQRATTCPFCSQPLFRTPDQPAATPPAEWLGGTSSADMAPTRVAAPPPPGSSPVYASLPAPASMPGFVPLGMLAEPRAHHKQLFTGIGGLVCGPLALLSFFLTWWVFAYLPDPAVKEALSAWRLMSARNSPTLVIFLWLIPIIGGVMALLALLHLVGAISGKVLSIAQLLGAVVGLVTVAGYFSYVQAEMPRSVLGSVPDVQIGYGIGFWVALLAFLGGGTLAVVGLARRA